MWFRVELHADDSVASCEPVEAASSDDRKTVFFVEAPSKAEAIVLARAAKALRHRGQTSRAAARIKEKRRQAGECVQCGKKNPRDTNLCVECTDRTVERARKRRDGAAPLKTPARSAEDLAEQYQRRLKYNTWDAVRVRLLRKVLAAYDASPKDFRAWLTAEIDSLEAESAKAAE